MRIIGERSLSSYVKILLDLIFVGGLLVFLTLPKSLGWYLHYVHAYTSTYVYRLLLVLLYITGLLALLIIYEIRKIFKTLQRKNPFMMDTVNSLKHMSIYSFLISFFYIGKIIIYNSFFTIIIVMIFMIAGLFAIVLAEVFRQAVEVKEENDFTI
jgi:hypothetical protein